MSSYSNATQIGDRNFQRQDFGVNPKWLWKFPGPKFARGNTNNHGNLFGIPEMAVEIYNVIFSQMQFDNLLVPQT